MDKKVMGSSRWRSTKRKKELKQQLNETPPEAAIYQIRNKKESYKKEGNSIGISGI
ncbi:hypothetical protein [Metabacillus indicus]|uniref:hypothetical protein n=1 Tax=Metabacillus indicus TaxID=246786 RepID=UPI000A6ED1B4|nr:hypothetical protein [Metabacillus indicus]